MRAKFYKQEYLFVRAHPVFYPNATFWQGSCAGFYKRGPSSFLLTAVETSQTSRHGLKGDRPLWFFHLSLSDRCHAVQLHWRCSLEVSERRWWWQAKISESYMSNSFFYWGFAPPVTKVKIPNHLNSFSHSSALRKCRKELKDATPARGQASLFQAQRVCKFHQL